MKLEEFNKPDYSKMTEQELSTLLHEKVTKLTAVIQKSNKKIENESRPRHSTPL